jgi:hypothetical protein
MERQRFAAAQTGAQHKHDEWLEPIASRSLEESPYLVWLQVPGFAPSDRRTLDSGGGIAACESVVHCDVEHRPADGVDQPPGRIRQASLTLGKK